MSEKSHVPLNTVSLVGQKEENQTIVDLEEILPEISPFHDGSNSQNYDQRATRANVERIPSFNPENYEEKFDLEDTLRQTNLPTGKRISSNVLSSPNSSESPVVSSYEDIEQIKLPIETLNKPRSSIIKLQGSQGDPEGKERSEARKILSRKKKIHSTVQPKSLDHVQHSPEVEDEENNPIRKKDSEKHEGNVGSSEDVDYLCQHEDEFPSSVQPVAIMFPFFIEPSH